MTSDLATAPGVLMDPSVVIRSRIVAAALAVLALVAGGTMLARPIAADDWHDYAVFAAEREATWAFSLVVGSATGAAFLTLGLAACLLVRGRGSTLATAGAVLTGLGGLGFAAGFFASGALHWYATADAVPEPAGRALMEYADQSPLHVFGPQMAGFMLAVLGCFLVAAALWRSRAVPRWIPVVLPVTFVLMMLAGTGVVYDVAFALFMASFVIVAWQVWRLRPAAPSQR